MNKYGIAIERQKYERVPKRNSRHKSIIAGIKNSVETFNIRLTKQKKESVNLKTGQLKLLRLRSTKKKQ